MLYLPNEYICKKNYLLDLISILYFMMLSYENIVEIKQHAQFSHLFDVQLNHVHELSKYDFVECHLVIYPYDRRINSKNIKFSPFEDYLHDINHSQKSVYAPIVDNSGKIFGLILGLIIVFLFLWIKPNDLVSIESIVSILGAYQFGKEFWTDLEKSLIKITQDKKIAFTENYYSYALQKGTLARYTTFARKQRLEMDAILPQKVEFIQQSNSQTIRSFYKTKDFKFVNNGSLHLLTVTVEKESLDHLLSSGFLIGLKISFTKKHWFTNSCLEMYQSINKDEAGCLDSQGNWTKAGILFKKSVFMGRIKFRMKQQTKSPFVLISKP